MSTKGSDRRRFPRLEALGRVDGCLLPAEAPLIVRDVSRGGFATESGIPFTPGAPYAFRFTTTDAQVFELTAVAVHCRLGHVSSDGRQAFVTGFEFLPSHTNTRAVEALLETLSGSIVTR
jgi:hypothetical protein